jgi:hypothetical protein
VTLLFSLKECTVTNSKGADVPQNALTDTLDCFVMLPSFCLQVVLVLVSVIVWGLKAE